MTPLKVAITDEQRTTYPTDAAKEVAVTFDRSNGDTYVIEVTDNGETVDVIMTYPGGIERVALESIVV